MDNRRLRVAATLIAILTFGLRAVNLTRSYDIHVDEAIYLGLSESVAEHLRLEFFGGPFYLHPPTFFFLEAAYLKVVQPSGELVHLIHTVRYLNLALAGLSAALLFLIGHAVAGWRGGAAAAVGFMIDPFVIRMNSVNLLDTCAITWVLVGHYLVLSLDTRAGRVGAIARPRHTWRVGAAGVAYGLALLSKDMTAPLTLLPLGVCFCLGWALPRRISALIGAIAVLTYATYPLTIAAAGDWEAFQNQKLHGLARFVGLVHETGFKQAGGPSFLQAIVANLEQYVTTYAMIGSGLVAIGTLLALGGTKPRLVATWTACAYALLAYSIAQGTLEEQFFYFLVVPSILATALAATLLFQPLPPESGALHPHEPAPVAARGEADGPGESRRCAARAQALQARLAKEGRRAWARVRSGTLASIAVVGLAFTLWSGYIWVRVHFTPDNGYERLVAFLRHADPGGERTAVTSTSAAIILVGHVRGSVASPDDVRANHIEYLELSTKNVENHYGEPSPEFYAWIIQHGEPVFAFRGRSYGTLVVYRLADRP